MILGTNLGREGCRPEDVEGPNAITAPPSKDGVTHYASYEYSLQTNSNLRHRSIPAFLCRTATNERSSLARGL